VANLPPQNYFHLYGIHPDAQVVHYVKYYGNIDEFPLFCFMLMDNLLEIVGDVDFDCAMILGTVNYQDIHCIYFIKNP
jgi:hypothetical protein